MYHIFSHWIIIVGGTVAGSIIAFILMVVGQLFVDIETVLIEGFDNLHMALYICAGIGFVIGLIVSVALKWEIIPDATEYYEPYDDPHHYGFYIVMEGLFMLFSSGVIAGVAFASPLFLSYASGQTLSNCRQAFILVMPVAILFAAVCVALSMVYMLDILRHRCPKCKLIAVYEHTVSSEKTGEDYRVLEGRTYTEREKVGELRSGFDSVDVYGDVTYKNPDTVYKVENYHAVCYKKCDNCGWRSDDYNSYYSKEHKV